MNTSEIIGTLKHCVDPHFSCEECVHEAQCEDGRLDLMLDAYRALTDMQDRCARYAEEIMALREALKKKCVGDGETWSWRTRCAAPPACRPAKRIASTANMGRGSAMR